MMVKRGGNVDADQDRNEPLTEDLAVQRICEPVELQVRPPEFLRYEPFVPRGLLYTGQPKQAEIIRTATLAQPADTGTRIITAYSSQ